MIGKMAIAAALPGFNDLGRSVTPTFLSRNRFYSQLSPHCQKMNKKSINQSINQLINQSLFKHGKWLSKLVFRHAV